MFDLKAARSKGVQDQKIAEFLAEKHKFDLDAARAKGVSDTKIAEFLAARPIAKQSGLFDRIDSARRGMQAETNENLASSGMPAPEYRSGTTPQQRATPRDPLAAGSREALIRGAGPRTLRADATAQAGLDAFTAPDDKDLLNLPSTRALIGRETERAKLETTRGANLEALRKEGERERRLEGADAEQCAREEYDRRLKAGDSKGLKPAEADWSTAFGLGATRAGRGLARGFYGTMEAFGDMLGSAELSQFGAEDAARQESAMAKAIRDAAGAVPEEGFKSIVADAIPTVISQGAPIAAAALTAVATRNPAAVQPFLNAAVLAPMGVQKFGENYRDAKAQGLATEDRVSYALGGALAEVLPERLSLGVLLDVLSKPLAKGGKAVAQKSVARELAERFLTAQGTELVTEEITTVADFILEQHYLDPDLSLKELQDRMERTALVTPVATTALMGAGAAGSAAGSMLRNGVSPQTRALRELQDTVEEAQFARDGSRVAADLLSPENAQMRERARPETASPEALADRAGVRVAPPAMPQAAAPFAEPAPSATVSAAPAAPPAAPVPSAATPAETGATDDAALLQDSILQAEQESAQSVPEPSQVAQEEAEARGPESAAEDLRPQFTHIPGRAGVAATERGTEVPFQYALVEADTLRTSQLDDLSPNPDYPQELQPRDRTRAGSEMQIARMAADIKPRRLGEAPMVSEGAPVIGPDAVVESGNGRTIALRRAYAAGKANGYYDWLEENADYFGFDPMLVARMRAPVLVRVRTGPVDRLEFVRQANESALLVMSPVEQARADAARIDSMDDLTPTEDGDFASSREFIRRFIGRLPATEQAGMIDDKGKLSQAGYARVRNAVLARAYGDSPVLARMVESMDDNLRNIGKALMTVAPAVAKARTDVADGALFDADLTPDLIAAVETLSRLKDEGRSVAEELAQMGMLDDGLSMEARELLAFLADNVRRPRKIAEFILRYTEALRAAGNPNQGSLLGETQAPTKAELLAAARGRTNEAATEQQPAAAAAQPERTGPAEPGAEDRIEPAAKGRDRRRAQGDEGQQVTPKPAATQDETPADAGVSASEILNPKNGKPFSSITIANQVRKKQADPDAWGVYRRGDTFVLRRWDADTGREADPNWYDQKRATEETAKRAQAAPAEPLLQTYTEAEIAAQEAAQREREAVEARAEREAAEQDRQARERAEVRARSEAAAQTFELGMDPMENLTGQGGFFVRMAHVTRPAAEPSGRYTAEERGARARISDGYTQDLFGTPVSETGRVPDTPLVQPGIAGAETLRAAGEVQGAKYAVEAGPRVTGFLKSAFERVESAPQAAHTLAGLRKNAAEHFQALVLDADNRPISVLNLFAGAIAQTSVYPEVVTKAIYETPGAAKVWFAHNHPSGKAEPSNADAILTRNLSEAFGPGTGIEVAGHVVIAGTRATELDAEGFEVGRAFSIPAGARTQSIKITERRFKKVGTLGRIIDSPAKAREDVPAIAEGKAGVVFLNAQHGPVGFLPMSVEQMKVLRDGKGARLLFGAAARSNASAAILHIPGGIARADAIAASTNLYEALNPRDIRVLDALHGVVSFAERGELTGTSRGFLSRSGQASGSIGDLRIDLADLEAVAVRHRKAFPGIPVIVARNEDALPEALRKQLIEADAYGDTAGVFWEGAIYLLRSGIEDIAHAEHTVVHEATHAGLAAMFGPELDAVMLDIWKSSIKVQLRAGRLRRRYSYSNVRATEEALADLGGEMVKVSGFKKLVAFIRSFFRTRGWVSAWSDNDVAYLVQRAREYGKRPDAMTVSRAAPKRSAGRSALLPSRKEAASFRAALKTTMDSMRSNVPPINVMTMPPVLQMLGTEALPVTISRDVVRKATNGIKHDVTLEAIERLPEALANPVMVFESATQAGDLVVLTEHKDASGRPVMFAVALNRTKGRGYSVSEISSAYGRKPSEYMNFVERGLLRYRNTAKSPDWLSDNGLQLPNSLSAARGSAEKGPGQVRDDGLQLPKAGSPSQGLWDSVPTEADAVNWAQARLSRSGQQSAIPPQPAGPVPPQQQGMPLSGGARGTNWDAPAMSRLDNFIQTIQDKFIDLKRVQQAINETGNAVPERFDAYLAEELYHGRVATRTKRFLQDEVKPLLSEMQEKGVTREALETYLHARHAPEANAAMAEANPNQQEIDVGRMQADAQVRALEAQLQQATAAGRSTRAIEDALRQAREERLRWNGAKPFRGTEAERLSLSGMSDADAAAHMASLTPEQRADMAALAARIDAINARTLRETERYGLMNAGTLDAWRNKYQFYVPLHRDEAHADSANHPIGQGYSNKGDTARRRTGSNEKVTNILGHILMQREAVLTRGEKNVVGLTLYGLALQNPNPEFWTVDRAPKRRTIDPDTGFVTETIDPTYKNKPNVFVVRVKGEDRAILFNERNERAVRMAASLKNLDVAEMERVTSSVAKVTRYFAAINTQYNPIFGIVNVVRDVQGAMLNLTSTPIDDKQAQVAADTLHAMRAIWNVEREGVKGLPAWKDLWNEFQEVGGITGYRELFRDANDRARDLEREMKRLERGQTGKYAHAVLDWLTDYNVALENAVRLAAYKAALDAGQSKKAAASIAKNLTVNFNRKGAVGRELGAWYAFFNASVQGTARLAETLHHGAKPGALLGKKGMKIIAGGLGLGMLQAVMGALFFDDDEWDKIPEYVKQTNTIIPIGGGRYVTIPMPLGFNVIPNFGRVLTELALDGGKDASKRAVDLLAFSLASYYPLGGSSSIWQTMAPTVFDPIVALLENKDWKGQPIARENLSQTDPEPGHRLAKDGASWPSKLLAEGFNRVTGGTDYQPGGFSPTPDQIDYVFGQIFGGVGREALKVSGSISATAKDEDLPAYRIPLAGRFYGDTADAKGNANRYYANVTAINGLENEIKGRAKDGKDIGAFMRDNPLVSQIGMANGAERTIAALRKQRREIDTLPGLTDRQRYEQKRALDIQIGKTMDLLNESVKQAERGGQKTLREWVRERAVAE